MYKTDMQRRFTFLKSFICALSFGLLLSACSSHMPSSQVVPMEKNQSKTQTENIQNLQMLSQSADSIGYQGCTKQGMYSVEIENQSACIHYWDYAAGQSMYLCAAPNCQHNSDSCNAFIARGGTVPQIVCNEENIFLFYPGYNDGDKSYLPFIEMADLNGSNRHTLYTFAANQEVGEGIAGNKDHLYFTLSTISSSGTGISQTLVSLNIKSGQLTEIYTTQKDMLFLLGAYESKIVMKELSMSKEIFDVYAFDVNTKELLQLEEYSMNDTVGFAQENKLFDLRFENQKVSVELKNWINGESAEISDCFVTLNGSASLLPIGYYNGILFVNSVVGTKEDGNLEVAQYAVDTGNRTVQKIAFCDPVTKRPLNIMGAVGENKEILIIEKNQYSGTSMESYESSDCYSIALTDYVQGNTAFSRIG